MAALALPWKASSFARRERASSLLSLMSLRLRGQEPDLILPAECYYLTEVNGCLIPI